MSLARTLLNGGTIYGSMNIDGARYGHSNGALRISMESIEELHEIFTESFYNIEQIELAAAHDGVTLENSQYMTVIEAAGTSIFQKIKEFFKKLWVKIKEFFHNVRRYFDSLILSGKEFCSKYKSEIQATKNLKDFTFKMYKYNNAEIDSFGTTLDDVDSFIEDRTKKATDLIGHTLDELSNIDDAAKTTLKNATVDEAIKTANDTFKKESETAVKDLRKKFAGGHACEDNSEMCEYIWSNLRGGATDEQDKEELDFVEVGSLATTLINSKASSNFTKMQNNVDNRYKKAIKAIDTIQTKVSAIGGAKMSSYSTVLNDYSSTLSEMQTIETANVNEYKKVYKERDAAYKACIMAAFSHFRKQKN